MTDRFDDGRPSGEASPPDEPMGDAPTPPMGLPMGEAPTSPIGVPQQPGQAGEPPPSDAPTSPIGLPEQPGEPLDGPEHEPPADKPDTPDQPRRGQLRYQDPANAKPRPPSLAEQRARQVAEREAQERELAQQADAERKRKLKRRLLIGGGVTVGLVAIVSIWYAVSAQADDVTAYCVADDDVVNEDNNCDENYVRSHGGYYGGGFFFIGGRQYHYHYGGNPTPIGQRISGGSTVRPQGANITTRSGKSIQRGGFGIRGGSGKSSGS